MKRKIDPVERLEMQLRGKASKAMGRINEDRSVQYILDHPEKYGCVDRSHIHVTPRGTKYIPDLFCMYFELNGKKEKAGWDIMVIPDATLNSNTHLIQVKSNNMPSSTYLSALVNFKVPSYVTKELHLWKDGKLIIMEL
jgi:hypothetical protein